MEARKVCLPKIRLMKQLCQLWCREEKTLPPLSTHLLSLKLGGLEMPRRKGEAALIEPCQLQTWEAVTSAIRVMQHFAGIAETGIPGIATFQGLLVPASPHWLPPCFDRRSAGPIWMKRNISWKVKTYPREAHLSRETMRVLMYYALKVWSEATSLNFHEVGSHSADISVEFLRLDHRDGYPFDGPGGMVAHAFFPGDPQRAGNVHFDGDEEWTFRSPDDFGTDLFAVAVHEFGHSLGLVHSPSKHSIMRPYYQGPVGDPLQYQLHMVDRTEIQKLYGIRVPHSTEKPDVTSLLPDLLSLSGKEFPDRCTSTIDAIAQIRGETFFFKGRYFWRQSQERHLISLRPALITGFWRGLPSTLSKVDAVYERPTDHRILFFSGPLYWVFKDNGVEEGYPRPVTDFGLPQGGIDGAFLWPLGRKTCFFKGGLHWCYDEAMERMEEGFLVSSALWEQFPTSVDAVLSENDGESEHQLVLPSPFSDADFHIVLAFLWSSIQLGLAPERYLSLSGLPASGPPFRFSSAPPPHPTPHPPGDIPQPFRHAQSPLGCFGALSPTISGAFPLFYVSFCKLWDSH
uniref:Peptidase metallopeptidase domain-containing protein n=1 Tax=Varanus komodoensis TaxID=61221 RepID=A0A8D2Q6W7_VARKO